jgi:hypothetical protein
MKTVRFFLALSVLSLITSSCYRRHGWAVRGRGADVTETRPMTGFDRISLCIDADVEYTPDTIFSFEVIAQTNVLAVLKTEVRNNILQIGYNGNVWDHNPIKIKVHSPQMRGITISGSGNVTSTKSYTTDVMECEISGSGDVKLIGITCSSAKGTISGSGNIYFGTGSTGSENLTISGSGNIEAMDLVSTVTKARISGSGNISINVTDDLEATISGSGNINYKGRPAVTTNISGSGRLIHQN